MRVAPVGDDAALAAHVLAWLDDPAALASAAAAAPAFAERFTPATCHAAYAELYLEVGGGSRRRGGPPSAAHEPDARLPGAVDDHRHEAAAERRGVVDGVVAREHPADDRRAAPLARAQHIVDRDVGDPPAQPGTALRYIASSSRVSRSARCRPCLPGFRASMASSRLSTLRRAERENHPPTPTDLAYSVKSVLRIRALPDENPNDCQRFLAGLTSGKGHSRTCRRGWSSLLRFVRSRSARTRLAGFPTHGRASLRCGALPRACERRQLMSSRAAFAAYAYAMPGIMPLQKKPSRRF